VGEATLRPTGLVQIPQLANKFFIIVIIIIFSLGLGGGQTILNGHGMAEATLRPTMMVWPPLNFLKIFFNFLFILVFIYFLNIN
jgi:hypothetical protein